MLGPTEGQNEQWREANRRRQRQTIRYRGLVPTPPPPRWLRNPLADPLPSPAMQCAGPAVLGDPAADGEAYGQQPPRLRAESYHEGRRASLPWCSPVRPRPSNSIWIKARAPLYRTCTVSMGSQEGQCLLWWSCWGCLPTHILGPDPKAKVAEAPQAPSRTDLRRARGHDLCPPPPLFQTCIGRG